MVPICNKTGVLVTGQLRPPMAFLLFYSEGEIQPPVFRTVAAQNLFGGRGTNPAAAAQRLAAGGAEGIYHGLMVFTDPPALINAQIQLPEWDWSFALRRTAEKGKFRAAVHHRLV